MSESVMMPEPIVVKPEAMETGSDDESAADLPLDPVTLTSVQTSPGNGEVVSALPSQVIADTLQQQTPTTPSTSFSSVAVASADGKTLKCPKCNWRYKYQEALEAHLADKHPEQAGGGTPSCRYCLHDEPHPRLPRGETHVCGYKPYRCDVCAYSTNSRGNLAIHMQSEKHLRSISQQPLVSSSPLTIPPSGDSSITAADAEDDDGDEMQNSGSGSGVGEPQQEPLRRSLLPPSSRRPMRCDVCNFETTATRYMRTHMASEKHLNAMVLAVGALKRQQQQLLTQQHSPCPSPPANGFPPPLPASFSLPHPHPSAARAADVIGSGSLSEGQGQTKDGGLFQCLVCSAFTCDSLAEMNKHIQRDRSHDTSRSTSIVDGVSYDCLVCPYHTTIRTNFNLHCKTEKHVLNVQLANHAFEGGQIVDTTNRDLVKFLPQVRCMACDAVAVSVYKMEVHLTDARHIKNSNVFNHIGELENQLISQTSSKKTAKLQQLTYECKLCSFTCGSKADLMKHIDTPRHIQLECLQQMDELKTGRLFSLNHFIAVTDLPSRYDNSRASTLESVALDVVLCPLCQEPQKSMAALEAHLMNNHKVTKEGIKVLLSVVKPSPSEPPSDVEVSVKTKHSRKSATPAQLVGFGGRRESDEDNSGQCLNLVKAESYDSFGALDLKVRDRASSSDGDASNDRPESSHRTKLHDKRTSFDSAESDINDNLIWREKADAESSEKLLRCVSCRATFDSIAHLNAHLQQEPSCHALAADHSVDPQALRYMDPSRPFKCVLCRESFTQKSILHAHFNSVSHLHHLTQLGGSASAVKLTSPSSATTRDGGFLAAETAGLSAKPVRNASLSSGSSSTFDRNVSAGDKTSKSSSSSAAVTSSSVAQTTAGTSSGVLPFTPAMFQQAAAAGMYNPLFSFYSAYNAGQLASLMPFASAANFPFSQTDYQKMLASFTAAQQQQKPASDVAAASKADGGKTTGSSSSSANRHFATTAEMKPSLADNGDDAAEKSLHDDYGQDTSERMLQEIAKVCDALSAGGVGQARIRRSQTHMKMLRNIGMECVLQFLEADRQPLDRGLPTNKTVDESVNGIDNTAGKDDATGIAVKREEAEVDNRKKVVEDMDTSGHLPCSKCSRRFSSVWILKAHEEADHGLIISSVVLEAIAKVVQESQPEAAAEMQQNVTNTMVAPPPPFQLTSGPSIDDKMSASKSKAAALNLALSSPSDVNKSAPIPAAEDGHSKSAEYELTSHAAAVSTSKSLSTPTPTGVNMLPMPLPFPMPLAMGAMTAAGAGMMPVFMPFAAPGARTIAPPIGAGGVIPSAALAAQAALTRPPALAPVGLAAAAANTKGAHQSAARLTAAAAAANVAANAAESDDKGGQGYQRRPRTRINEEQLKVLRANFDINNPPGETEIKRMVNDTGLPFQVIKHWFRNTLFKERQRNIDSPYNFSNPPTTTLSLDEQGMPQTKKDAIKAGTIPEVDESNASADETAGAAARQAQTVVEHAQPTPPPPFPATTLQRAVSHEEPQTPVTPIIIQPIANGNDKESRFESLLEDTKVAVDKKTSLENKEKMLWSFFKQNPYPIPAVVQQLVVKLGMQPNEITRWFRKTRRKERKLTDVADYGSAMMVQDGKSLTALIFPGQQQQSGSAVSVSASVLSPGSTPPISADVLAPHASSNILNLAGGALHNVKYESSSQQEIAERNGNTSLATDFSKVKDELAENGAAAMYDEDDGHSTDSDTNIKDSPPSILANKRLRTALTPQQIDQLCREYTDDNYPSMEKMARIAESLGLKHRVVRVWFQNRRAYTKKGLVAPYMPTDVNSMPFSCSMGGNGFLPSKRAHDDDSSSRNADDDYSSLAADNDLHADDLIIDLSLTEADDSEEAASPSKRSKIFDEDMEVDYAGESKGGLKMNSQLSASMSSMFPGMNFGTGGNGGSGYVRRNRTQLSLLQIRAMVAIYRDDTMPTATQCELLGHAIGLPRRVVQVWFQNQRAKEKRGVNCQQRLATLMSDAGGEALSDTIHLSLTPGECRLCFEAYGDSSAMSAHIFSANHLHRLIVHLSAGKTGKAAAAAATTAEGKTKYESQTQVKNAVSHTDSKNNIAALPTSISGLAAMIPGMLTGDSKVIPPSPLAMSAAAAPITSPTAAPFANMESFYMYNMAMALGSPLAMLQIPAAAITTIQRQLDDNSGSTVVHYFNDGLSFSDLANVVTAKDVDNTREVSVDVGFICRKCRMVYPIRDACVGHQRFACYAAVAASGSWDPTQTSVKLEQRQFECQPCGVRCSSVSDYHAHCLTPRHVAALP